MRIDLTVPPGHELVAESNPGEDTHYDALDVVIRDAFNAARRQLQELTDRQRKKVKTHEMQETTAIVTQLFRDQGYGFLKALDDQEIYFNRNSILHDDFDRLEIGTGVHFFLEQGEQGPRSSTVKIIDKPGSNVGKSAGGGFEPPRGWK